MFAVALRPTENVSNPYETNCTDTKVLIKKYKDIFFEKLPEFYLPEDLKTFD